MDPQFEAALQPLFGLTSDGQLLLLAQAESGTLTVAQSKQLGQLSVEEVVGSLPEEPFPEGTVLVTKKETNRAGSDVAWITLEQDDPPNYAVRSFSPVLMTHTWRPSALVVINLMTSRLLSTPFSTA